MILHQILDIYPRIQFINKGLSIVQKLYVPCDSLKFVWFVINRNKRMSGRIVYLVDHIVIFSNPCLCYILCLTLSFRLPPSFWLKDFVAMFLNDVSHVGGRQISQKLILYQILDIKPQISFTNKGLSIVQKLHVRCE